MYPHSPGNPAIKGIDPLRPVALRPHFSVGLPFSVLLGREALRLEIRCSRQDEASAVPVHCANVTCVNLLISYTTARTRAGTCRALTTNLSPPAHREFTVLRQASDCVEDACVA